jgi:hypothetical protein
MNRKLLIPAILALVMMATAAGVLVHVDRHQALSPPGVRTHALSDSIRLEAELPARVLHYESKWMDPDAVTLGTLPKDTSFGQRLYQATDGFSINMNVVLMGRDRTSMHKPQICLTGHGWNIDDLLSTQTSIPVRQPYPYDLPVVGLVAHAVDDQKRTLSGVYVYWYVADDALSASTSGFQRMYWMAAKLLRTGVLQRWAYVSCFAICAPGQENATFERMKPFIAACVPEFQLYPKPKPPAIAASP